MPNTLAFLVLALWPGVALWLFSRLPVERAMIWTIVGGYMALPPIAAFDLPVMPALDKYVIANLSALTGCLIHARDQVLTLPRSRLVMVLLAAFVASPIATILTNGDPMFIGGGLVLPGLRPYDAISVIINQMLFVIPFFLARAVLSSPEAHRDILRVFMLGGLIYSIPMLIEIRLSPQLNTWIYGFFQHSFHQMMRQGGFRPIVFMPHGLWVAFFAMSATVAAAALARDADRDRPRLLATMAYLFVVLVLCKSLASLLYAMVLVPVILLAPLRIVLWVTGAFALIAVSYPVLRGGGFVPTEALTTWAYDFNAERGQSLEFRFNNETMLLEKANDRPLFGWGTWGRNQIYDLATGRMISITDGRWIIVIGMFGWLGYLAEFGLLTVPLMALALRAVPGGVPVAVAATSLILGINLIDMLPNATLLPITWMLAGALTGYVEHLSDRAAPDESVIDAASGVQLQHRPLQSIL